MSDVEQDVRTPDADVSVYASPGNSTFVTTNDSSLNACLTPTTCNDLEEIAQKETEEAYFTPTFEKFLQWRQSNRSSDSSFTPVLKMMHNESTPEMSPCDESLIEQIDMLSLSTSRYPHVSASTPAKGADTTLVNVESTPKRRDLDEDPPARILYTRHTETNTEMPQIVGRDEISGTGNKTKDELTSDYSTMESSVPDNNGSSSKVTSDSSIDQLPSRGTRQSDRPSREDAIVDSAEPETKGLRNPVNAESTRLADHSPSVIGDGEVFEADTFDDLYSRNVELAQHYLKRMMTKEQVGGCFGSHWSRRIMNIPTLCRSPQRSKKPKGGNQSCRERVEVSSPVRESAKASTDVAEWRSPSLKLRFAIRGKKQIQTSERLRPGKAFHLGGKIVDR